MKKQKGREYLDPTPVEWPLGVSVPESLEQKIARMVRLGVSEAADRDGFETFEEADDFDVDDPEAVPGSTHELDDDQERILADQAAIRRIPPQFREAFERETARRREATEKAIEAAKKPPISKDVEVPTKEPT